MASEKIVIAGGGILGFAIGIALLQRSKNLSVTIFEKESHVAEHASGRNSGVLHAGFYYSPESLKAKFCRDGNAQLRKIISKYNVPLKEIGKVVIAQSAAELAGLEKLYNRGIANGVRLEMTPKKDLSKYEPLAHSAFDFLWSPTTAVSDPIAVTEALAKEFVALGGKIEFNSEISFDGNLLNHGVEVPHDHFINSAGAYATNIAQSMGFAKDFRVMPFLGTYRQVPQARLPISTLIYPVPHPVNPFLGVHLTLTIDGMVKVGPTAIPILGREQYGFNFNFGAADPLNFIRNGISVALGKKHKISSVALSEFPNLFEKTVVKKVAKLVPSAAGVKDWKKKRPGIRSQLLNITNGELVQDFVIESDSKSTHVLNAVSPGWTAALPFGDYVAEKVLGKS